MEMKQDLKSEVDRAIGGSGIPVRIAQPGDRFNGDDPRNIVNRLSPAHGIQLEQSLRARRDFGPMIADAVASSIHASCQAGPTTLGSITAILLMGRETLKLGGVLAKRTH
jgi:phage replication-related protein YjqB (UPF0714/DUF867 family)